MAEIIDTLAVYEAVCSGSIVAIGAVVIEKRRNHLQVFKSAKIPWDDFIQLPNWYNAIQYAETTLYERIQSHFFGDCVCDGHILFSAGEATLLNGTGNLQLAIPENVTLVPCNSPATGCPTPDTPRPIVPGAFFQSMGGCERTAKRRRLNSGVI